jgi:hypothetical protein
MEGDARAGTDLPGMRLFSGGMNSAEPAPLPDERVLEMGGIKLAELTGTQWRVEPGPLLKGPGTLGVRPGPRHSDSYRHFDLEFLLNVDRAAETSLPDCAVALASDPGEAAREAIAAWADTTAVVALELLDRQGRYATHFAARAPGCFPGWHAIVGGVSGWGAGEDSAAKRQWVADTWPWAELAPVMAAGLTRPFLNGVRIFIGQGGDCVNCEVKINGTPHAPSAAALAAMNWPRTAQMSTAKVFLLLVHPEEDSDR